MPFIATIFLGVFIAGGLIFSGFGVRTLLRDHAASDWPRVPGRITRATVIDTSDSDGNSYKPGISYRYAVNGQEFTGERISFGADGISSSGSFADRYVAKYSVGREVQVAYQQQQPSISALETGISKRSFFKVAFGLGFAFMGAWFRLIMWLMDS